MPSVAAVEIMSFDPGKQILNPRRSRAATAGWFAGEATIIAIAACLKARESCG